MPYLSSSPIAKETPTKGFDSFFVHLEKNDAITPPKTNMTLEKNNNNNNNNNNLMYLLLKMVIFQGHVGFQGGIS